VKRAAYDNKPEQQNKNIKIIESLGAQSLNRNTTVE
jgi:hypothetical protein